MPNARRGPGLWIAAGLVAVIGGAALLASTDTPADRRRAEATPRAPVVTAPVERRVLRDVVTLDGKVAAGDTLTVMPAGGGPPPDAAAAPGGAALPGAGPAAALVVTRAAPDVGTALDGGTLLAAVSDQPVFLLQGDLPLYRDIAPGATGPDVAALQAGLRDAGFHVADADGRYGPSTQRAVAALWRDNGLTPAVDPAVAAQLDDARAALAQVPEGMPDARAAAEAAVADLSEQAGPRVPMSSIVMAPALPATVVTTSPRRGAVLDPTAPVLALSAVPPVLHLVASPAQAALLTPGLRATTTIGGAAATGTVTAIGPAPTDGTGPPVTVALDQPVGFDAIGSSVSVEVEVTTSGTDVLAVPASALRTTADGRDVVIRVAPGPAGARQRIEVEVGSSVAGYVELRGADPPLSPGDEVLVGGR